MQGLNIYLADGTYDGAITMTSTASKFTAVRVRKEDVQEYDNMLDGLFLKRSIAVKGFPVCMTLDNEESASEAEVMRILTGLMDKTTMFISSSQNEGSLLRKHNDFYACSCSGQRTLSAR